MNLNIQNIINSHNRKMLDDKQQTIQQEKLATANKNKNFLLKIVAQTVLLIKLLLTMEKLTIGMTQGKFKKTDLPNTNSHSKINL